MAAIPPGNEADIIKEQRIQNEILGALKNECHPDFSNYKGSSFIYKMSNFSNARSHMTEQLMAAN